MYDVQTVLAKTKDGIMVNPYVVNPTSEKISTILDKHKNSVTQPTNTPILHSLVPDLSTNF